jgi:quinolinate synthase
MVRHVRISASRKFLVATETGIVYRMRREAPNKEFIPVAENAVCDYMKLITLEKIRRSLREGVYPVKVPPDVARRARVAIERMLQFT